MNKRILSLLLTLVLCIGLFPTAIFASTPKYLAIGDSITTGYRLDTEAGEQNFAELVAKANGYELTNAADNGETSATLLEKLSNHTIDVSDADVITLTIGGNDIMNALYEFLAAKWSENNPDSSINTSELKEMLISGGADISALKGLIGYLPDFLESDQAEMALSDFTDNLMEIVTAIKTENPEAIIIVTTQYNPYSYLARSFGMLVSQVADIANTFDLGLNALNNIIVASASSLDIKVADVYIAFEAAVTAGTNPCNPAVNMSDFSVDFDFHPNATGHIIIANTVNSLLCSVNSVSIDLSDAVLDKGDTKQFSATIDGTGNYDSTVIWSVSGNVSDATMIDEKGLLTVAEDEISGSLIVKATSCMDAAIFDTVEVKVNGGSIVYFITYELSNITTDNKTLYRLENDENTYTAILTANDGYFLPETISITIDGNTLVDGYTYDNTNGKLTIDSSVITGNITIMAEGAEQAPTFEENPFVDVSVDDWFYEDVMFVYQNKLMNGDSETTFSPYLETNRAQIATILYRVAGCPEVSGDSEFVDVVIDTSSEWYYDAVLWVQQNGIMQGYGDGIFGILDKLTHEQLAVIFANCARRLGVYADLSYDLSGFVDANKVSSWALDDVEWAVAIGIITNDDGTLASNEVATRVEIAVMLHRFVNYLNLAGVNITGLNG